MTARTERRENGGGGRSRQLPPVSLIAALARNGVIGVENRLPWHLPEDLRRFRALTMGKPVVMGRRTHESIGRALPGRRNIVLTRRREAACGRAGCGCEHADSLEHARAMTADAPEVMVIGGARCYEEALPQASRMYLTLIDEAFGGDTRFPPWDEGEWMERKRELRQPSAEVPFGYAFVVLERRQSRQSTERVSPL